MPLDNYSLFSVQQKLSNPRKGFSFDTVSFEFFKEDCVVDFVKRLCKVKVYNIHFIIFVEGFIYLFDMAKKLCHATSFLPEAMLVPTDEPVFFEVID